MCVHCPLVERIDLHVHPLVLELTGKKTPSTGLESKFSVYFAAALAIVVGSAGVRDFSDANAKNPSIAALRDRVTATVDPALKEEQARATIILKDGRRLEKFIEHVVGSVERPMSDADLEAKFRGLAEGVLAESRIQALIGRCWDIEGLASDADLAASARPA